MSEVISSTSSLRAGSHVFSLLMLFLGVILHVVGQQPAVAVRLTLWYYLIICHQDDVCENYIGSVYVGGYCGLSESGLRVFGKLCQSAFL